MLGAMIALFAAGRAGAQTSNNVAPSGFTAWLFNGSAVANPTLTLYRGITYIFNVNALGHPFYVQTNIAGLGAGAYNNGVVNNGAATGIVTFTVPANAPASLFYACANHASFGMHGALNILNPPTPPSGQIVQITLTPTSVTMRSLGAASWSAIPEYSSNLTAQAWTTVPGFSNVLANGTNTTMFGRLEPICGPNVLLRIRNQFP